ncbi:PREDICTED: F-box/kelch-repeat protein At3g04660-like [Camelina sativa]|uniref:F-box/kelch-repeat protein At3g04660-like n=1 Tax=Camelina sativa TaxID=90675 RepID=A0ABM0WAC8_CAMSA|nr:PREDICTED: F-box/kelch-repeat protein At3g04660-like [Camelina sativa]
MGRVRTRKETAEKNRKRSEKQDETHPLPFIPRELIVEILVRVPARSIARFICVSKLWSSIVRSQHFTKSYQLLMTRRSDPTRPRLLFSLCHPMKTQQLFLSQQDPSSDHHRVNISMRHPTPWYEFSIPVRGLICCQYDGNKVMIWNPSTGQLLPLPRIKSRRRGLFSFFGYDPVNGVYKVLCMTVLRVRNRFRKSQVVSEEHQVFTLGANQQWRSIECKHPHLPPRNTKGICINGVVYYHAWIRSERFLISFDLISEEFNVIKSPADCWFQNLVNYNGKIALTTAMQIDHIFRLWVLKDACSEKKWYRISSPAISSRSWQELAGKVSFELRGTLSTGELIFAPLRPINPVHLISFDPKRNKAKKVVVEGLGDNFSSLEVYLDHVESPMFLFC